jgi:hypothetical protein
MPNDYTGRIWKIVAGGETPFGTSNVKIKGGIWTGGTAGDTFTITDVAGRVYTWIFEADSNVTFQELGWLSCPVIFGGTFSNTAGAEVNLYLGTK